jgi:hypothetical protein
MKMARRAISLSDQLCVSCFRGVFLARVLEVATTAAWCRRNRNQNRCYPVSPFFWVPRKQHPHGTRCVKPRCTVWVAQAVTQFAASGSNADTVRGVFASSSHFATAQMNSAFTRLAWRPDVFFCRSIRFHGVPGVTIPNHLRRRRNWREVRRSYLGGHQGSSASRLLFREAFFRRQCRWRRGSPSLARFSSGWSSVPIPLYAYLPHPIEHIVPPTKQGALSLASCTFIAALHAALTSPSPRTTSLYIKFSECERQRIRITATNTQL